jgi:putative hydrolase of HD superfamily
MDRLRQQIAFILEVDRVKQIVRRSLLADGSRNETDGEHMWHVALAAMVLAEHVDGSVDVARVVRMLLVHDLVEIDAGDFYVFDASLREAKEEAETACADRIFALLPDDQRDEFRGLWEEFEARETPEAQFASVMDRLLPLLLNHATEGATWKQYEISVAQVLELNSRMSKSSGVLWVFAQELIDECVAKGFLASS